MSHNPPSPETTKDILVCDKDSKFLRQIDACFSNNQKLNVHSTSILNIDEIISDLASSPFHFIIIGPNLDLPQEFNIILNNQKTITHFIKVIENESLEIIVNYHNKGLKNMVSIDSLLQNLELVLNNITHLGSFIDPYIISNIIPILPKTQTFNPNTSLLKPKAQAVLVLLKNGYTYLDIAKELNISIDSVRYYIKIIYRKLNVKSKINAINKVNLLKETVHSF